MMKPFHLYDTRERRKVELKPIEAGHVRLYTCGPTVYLEAHIGNFRTYMFEDLLRRTLKFLGYRVTQVMNLTDVDDKTIREARSRGVPLGDVTAPVVERFFEELDMLRIERAEFYPRATEHVPDMIAMVEKLLEKGFAYRMDDSIYYSISKFPEYGRLSGMKIDRLYRGVRIDADEYEKGDFRDFALWKGWTADDGEVYWDSPFGRGRPGWHIECSAMSQKYLGEEFDIHTGGEDNIFPHHENEIAQSVAATGARFAHHWMHSVHLLVKGEKMSKSLGNFYTPRGLVREGYPPRIIRYALLATHYRQQMNLTHEVLDASRRSLERLDTLYQEAAEAAGEGAVRAELKGEIDAAGQRFTESLQDDLSISGALAALFDLVSAAHRLRRDEPLRRSEGEAVLMFWRDADRVLGVLLPEEAGLPQKVVQAVRERSRLRGLKEFAKADRVREILAAEGYELEDGEGATVVIWGEGRKVIKD